MRVPPTPGVGGRSRSRVRDPPCPERAHRDVDVRSGNGEVQHGVDARVGEQRSYAEGLDPMLGCHFHSARLVDIRDTHQVHVNGFSGWL